MVDFSLYKMSISNKSDAAIISASVAYDNEFPFVLRMSSKDPTIFLERGDYGFLFRSEFFFRTTQELEYLFFFVAQSANFFPEFNIRLYDKNSESDYFFFLHQNQNIFFSTITPSPFKLNGRSLRIPPCWSPIPTLKQSDVLPSHFMQLSAFGASF
jgi:hypothetical protein